MMADKKKVLIIGAGAAGMVTILDPIGFAVDANSIHPVLRVYFGQAPRSF
jgi:NADH dehydrogenase FAD-containing subunit